MLLHSKNATRFFAYAVKTGKGRWYLRISALFLSVFDFFDFAPCLYLEKH